jgi:hypothetical protein
MKKFQVPLILGLILAVVFVLIFLIAIISLPDFSNDIKPTPHLYVTHFVPSKTSSDINDVDKKKETLLPGVFSTGMKVMINGTGGEGLRIHTSPNIKSDTLTIASERSLWIIIEGPELNEGRIWWKLERDDGNIRGWGVQEYLAIAQ